MSEEKKKLMQRAGISEPSDLLLCGATELDALRDALKPIPRRMFEDYRRKYLVTDGPNGWLQLLTLPHRKLNISKRFH